MVFPATAYHLAFSYSWTQLLYSILGIIQTVVLSADRSIVSDWVYFPNVVMRNGLRMDL